MDGDRISWGILAVNVIGGLVMGLIVELGALKLNNGLEMRAFLTTGVLGGFTIFSTFSLDAALLIERGRWFSASLYVAGAVVPSLLALFAALALVRTLS